MKLLKKIVLVVLSVSFFTGCGVKDGTDVLKKLSNKIGDLNSYHLSGLLEIYNNENTYLYDVDVSYLKENFFRVSLKNKTNNHEQIILRNTDGVFVVTPSLNKSFKFQSEWPYNNSQSYLLHSILNDIKNDSDKIFEVNDDGYLITVKSNFSNNKDLVKEKVFINKDMDIKMVEILDMNDIVKMKMTFDNIDYNYDYDDEFFKLESNMSVFLEDGNIKNVLGDILYPMYIPQNTFLSGQDKVSLENGERIIMTFSGDYPFMIIQETLNYSDDSLISVSGEPFQLIDSIGILDDSSITWISNGVEYYLVSNSLDREQLVEVANSMSTGAIAK